VAELGRNKKIGRDMNFLRGTFYSVCILSTFGTGLAQQVAGKPVLSAAPTPPSAVAPPPSEAAGPLNVSPNYIIGADDSIQVTVWKEQQLSATLPVRPDGKISLPLINDIPAAGLTPMQLQADITQRLTKFVTDPVVNVTVLAVNSKRVFIRVQWPLRPA
jgi:polysaccharide export outer membrane protein